MSTLNLRAAGAAARFVALGTMLAGAAQAGEPVPDIDVVLEQIPGNSVVGMSSGGSFRLTADRVGGVQTLRLLHPDGLVLLTAPSWLEPGDVVSGTVRALPTAGKKQASKAIGSMTFGLAGESFRVDAGSWRLELPAEGPAAGWPLEFRRANGKTVASARVPLPDRAPLAPPGRTPILMIDLPRAVRAGRPLLVMGPFDGDATTTGIRIGDVPGAILAETGLYASASFDADRVGPGPHELTVEEYGETVTTAVNTLELGIEASKEHLKPGDRETLTVRVAGLEGLEGSLTLSIENHAPEIARLGSGAGAEAFTVPVPLEEVRGGEFRTELPLEALARGVGRFSARISRRPAWEEVERAEEVPEGLAGWADELVDWLADILKDILKDALEDFIRDGIDRTTSSVDEGRLVLEGPCPEGGCPPSPRLSDEQRQSAWALAASAAELSAYLRTFDCICVTAEGCPCGEEDPLDPRDDPLILEGLDGWERRPLE